MFVRNLIDDVGPALAGKPVFLQIKIQRVSRPRPGWSRSHVISDSCKSEFIREGPVHTQSVYGL